MKAKTLFPILLVLTALPYASAQQEEVRQPKKVLFINSYHKGYPSSDSIMQGYENAMKGKFLRTEYYFMDTHLNNDPTVIQNHVNEVMQLKETFQPDVIVVSDDNAVQHVVVPNWTNGSTPVIFCGVNWSSKPYGFPSRYVTGMVETQPIGDSIQALRESYPELRRLAILTEDTPTARDTQAFLEPLYQELGIQANYVWVSNFEEWKRAFTEVPLNADALFLPAYGSIKGWNDDEAVRFVEENIKKPVFTCDEFMMKYAAFGLTQVPQEQGEWAANAVVQVIYGKGPHDIPLAQNRQAKGYINANLAEKIGFKPSEELLKQCEVIQ